MLLKLLDFGLEDGYFRSLRLSVLRDDLQILVEKLIFISLCFDVAFKMFIILPCLNVELILNLLSLFDKNIHHYINLLSDMVCFLFEQLKHIIASNQLVLQAFDLLVDRGAHIIDFTAGELRSILASICLAHISLLIEDVGLAGEGRVTKNCNSWTFIVMDNGVQAIRCKFVDLGTTIYFLLFEWAILNRNSNVKNKYLLSNQV